MHIVVTGGTGFVGRALVLRLRRDGHRVTAFVRDVGKARSQLGMEAEFVHSAAELASALSSADAVVNLAGAPVLGGRWTDARKRAIRDSRIGVTRMLTDAMKGSAARPGVLVSASAVGVYGDGGDQVLTEDAPVGDDFLAGVCRDWETEAFRARDLGVRTVALRIGVVLGRGGGALDSMLPPFRLGLGGPVGSGRQYVPWIHIEDLVELIVTAMGDERYEGALNATGPEPVTFGAFASALGGALSRPSVLPLPAFVLKTLFGGAAAVLLNGQRAVPARATALGFPFRFGTVDEALRDVTGTGSVSIEPAREPFPDSDYLRSRKPVYELKARVVLDRPLAEVFAFFSRPENLGLITPAGMQFRITRLPELLEEGSEIDYSLKVGPIPIKWRTRIDAWTDGKRFVDSQLKGPYASWWHEHAFEADGERTIMTDRVLYAPPAGPVGKVANSVFIGDELKGVFGYRASVMRLRFGSAL